MNAAVDVERLARSAVGPAADLWRRAKAPGRVSSLHVPADVSRANLMAELVGGPVLAAGDVDELDLVLDERMRSTDFRALLALSGGMAAAGRVPAVTPRQRRVFGAAVARTIHQGFERSRAVARVVDATRSAGSVPVRPSTVDELLDDAGTPLEVRELLLDALVSGVALLALTEAMRRGRPLAPWLASALADRWVRGPAGLLRLLASTPGVDVSADLVPLAERLDLAAIERRHRAFRARVEASAARPVDVVAFAD